MADDDSGTFALIEIGDLHAADGELLTFSNPPSPGLGPKGPSHSLPRGERG